MSTLVLSPPGEATMGKISQPDRESRATKYWAQHIRSVAGPLLKLTGSYPPHDQEAHLKFLDSHVASVLGPMPTEPHGVYTMPYAGSPVEFTVTSTSGGKPKAHIQFESDLQPSSTTQLLALALLWQWGHSGFLAHCERAAAIYRRRRDIFLAAAERHLVGKASWSVPSAGMFVYLNLRLAPGRDTFEIMVKESLKIGVLAIPGVAFLPNPRTTSYLRVSYSLVPEDEMDEACRRIARLVDSTWKERDEAVDVESSLYLRLA